MGANFLNIILESNLINFLIALVALVYLLGKLIPDSTNKRKKELEAEIAKAEQTKKDAEEKLRELEKEIERSKAESLNIVSYAKDTAENIQGKMLEDTKQEIARLNQSSQRAMEQHKNLVIENIKSQIASLAIDEIEKNLHSKKAEVDKIIQAKLKKDLQKI